MVIGAERAAVLADTRGLGIDIEAGLRGKDYVVANSLETVPADANRIVVLMDNCDCDLGAAVDGAVSVLSRNPGRDEFCQYIKKGPGAQGGAPWRGAGQRRA